MNRLIVLHQGAIGDFLLALSVIQSVRAAANADHTTAIASAPSARLAAGRSAIDACLSPEDVALHTLFADTPPDSRLATAVAGTDHILSFLSAPSEPIHDRLCCITSARVISLDPRPTPATIAARLHITAQWTAAIRAQGFPVPDPTPAIVTPSAKRGVDASPRSPSGGSTPRPPLPPLTRGGFGGVAPGPPSETESLPTTSACHDADRNILIHPGSGGQSKCWPLDRFTALADALQPAAIHWLLGPAELDSAPTRFAPLRERSSARREPLLIEHDLERAAEHMAGMDLYIGNDAGATHLAAALGIPTLAIFGPTDPAVWRPLGVIVRTVAPPAPAPIAAVPLAAVVTAARSFISLKPRNAP